MPAARPGVHLADTMCWVLVANLSSLRCPTAPTVTLDFSKWTRDDPSALCLDNKKGKIAWLEGCVRLR